MAKLTVVRAERNLMGSKITVEADKTVSAVFESMLGDREFYLHGGHRLTIRVKGRDWRRGDTLSMSELVSAAWDWSNIPWQWD